MAAGENANDVCNRRHSPGIQRAVSANVEVIENDGRVWRHQQRAGQTPSRRSAASGGGRPPRWVLSDANFPALGRAAWPFRVMILPLSLPQATCSLPTLLSISFPEVQSPEPAIRWEKQWQQRELLQRQHPGACRSPWKPREGRAPRDRQPAPCLLSDPHPRYSTWEMNALRRRGGSQRGGEPGEAGFGQRPREGLGKG